MYYSLIERENSMNTVDAITDVHLREAEFWWKIRRVNEQISGYAVVLWWTGCTNQIFALQHVIEKSINVKVYCIFDLEEAYYKVNRFDYSLVSNRFGYEFFVQK